MTTLRTHQSSAFSSREAAWQGCARATATDRGYLRSLPFPGLKGCVRVDTQAISLIPVGSKLGQANPEASP